MAIFIEKGYPVTINTENETNIASYVAEKVVGKNNVKSYQRSK